MLVTTVLSDCGDGSSRIHWFKEVELEDLYKLEEASPETWGSGDGLQYKELNFPDSSDFDSIGITFTDYQEALDRVQCDI